MPPHDIDAETSTLGAMMLASGAVEAALDAGLDAEHFYSPINAGIYAAVIAAYDAGARPPDPVATRAHLAATDLAATDDGRTLLTMVAGTPSTTNAGVYAARILDCAQQRRLIGLAAELREVALTGNLTAAPAITERITTLATPAGAGDWPTNVAPYAIDWTTLDEDPETAWLIEPFLAEGRAHALWAVAKAGKSLLALEAAISIATGGPFLLATERPPADVIYVDAEMTRADVRERIADLGIKPTNLDRLHYFVQPDLPPIDTAEGGRAMREVAGHYNAHLVVIDTVASTVAGDENEADTYRAVARYITNPLKAEGITTLRLDHGGKNAEQGQRGSSAKADDVDVVWRLSTVDLTRLRLTATHRRLAWVPTHLDLVRGDAPLSHHLARGTGWPEGTAEVADLLERFGVPLDATLSLASDVLKHHGEGRRRATVAAALRWLRHPDRRDEDGRMHRPGARLRSVEPPYT